MASDSFSTLLERALLPARLNIVQLGPRWRCDEPSVRLRDQLDAEILREFLRGREIRVRRIVLYDVPSDEGGSGGGHKAASLESQAWLTGLVRDLFVLDMPALGQKASYQVRQVILDRVDRDSHLPIEDGWSDGSDSTWGERFESTWNEPRCIENNVLGADPLTGPKSDRDPRWFLWQ